MKLHDVYRACVEAGIRHDPRGEKAIRRLLAARDIAALPAPEAALERLAFGDRAPGNPYPDTRLLYGEGERELRGAVLVGIDVGIGEILVADRLRERSNGSCGRRKPGAPHDPADAVADGIGLVIAHRSECRDAAPPAAFFRLRADLLRRFGVPVRVADRYADAAPSAAAPESVARDVDAAALLDIPYLCVHTPADNLVTAHLQSLFDANTPATVGEALALLLGIPEYRTAADRHRGPRVALGQADDAAGRVFVDMLGGTAGAPETYARLAAAGCETVVTMCVTERHLAAAEAAGLAVIDAGHVASDTLGINLLLDEVFSVAAPAGSCGVPRPCRPQDFVACSGFRRVDRSPSEDKPARGGRSRGNRESFGHAR